MTTVEFKEKHVEPIVDVVITMSESEAQALIDLLQGGVGYHTLQTIGLADLSAKMDDAGMRSTHRIKWYTIAQVSN